MNNLQWAVDQTLQLTKNRDNSALDEHRRWIARNTPAFKAEYRKLLQASNPAPKPFEYFR